MTEEELQELETLREEKRQRQQRERASGALKKAGVPASFAPLLAGTDDADTDRRATDFCVAYQQAMADGIRERLPSRPPQMAAAAIPARPRRGVQRLR